MKKLTRVQTFQFCIDGTLQIHDINDILYLCTVVCNKLFRLDR
jgi:hypothetical protein